MVLGNMDMNHMIKYAKSKAYVILQIKGEYHDQYKISKTDIMINSERQTLTNILRQNQTKV